jgi:hypothetical protein
VGYDTYLYMTLHPNNALIASQLDPPRFARHYTSGSSRHYRGKVIFAEIDPEFRNPFFPIDEILETVYPHEDGRPKATKFIASYRVLEHMDFDCIHRVFLTSQEGECIPLEPGSYVAPDVGSRLRLFAEITPLRMLVLAEHDFEAFGKYVTNPKNTKSAPKQFYTQIELDVAEFVAEFEANAFRPSPVPEVHPSTLRDAFVEINMFPDKHYKGISLDSRLDQISYKLIDSGFMFSSQEVTKYFPMLGRDEIESRYFKFWRTM